MKKTIRENYRLEVFVETWHRGINSHDDSMRALRELKESVNRHVDDVEKVNMVWNEKEVCEFCEEPWEIWEEEDEEQEPGYKKGMPVCCEKAQEEFTTNTGKVDATGRKRARMT